MLRFHGHAFFKRGNAGAYIWAAVDYHDAVSAAAYRAEDAPGLVPLFCVAVNLHAAGFKRSRDRLSLVTGKGFAVECELDFPLLLLFPEYRVICQSHFLSTSSPARSTGSA
jgi:hypothetical protein